MSTGRYTVHQVADARMPEGCTWAFVEIPPKPGFTGSDYMFIVARSSFGPEAMADAWAAFRRLKFEPARNPEPSPTHLQLVV